MRPRVCEAEAKYDAISQGCLLSSIEAYERGERTLNLLNRLSRAYVWARACGLRYLVTTPSTRDRWDGILSKLVCEQLGDRHCLNCEGFFDSERVPKRVVLSIPYNISGPECPHCGSILSEEIGA